MRAGVAHTCFLHFLWRSRPSSANLPPSLPRNHQEEPVQRALLPVLRAGAKAIKPITMHSNSRLVGGEEKHCNLPRGTKKALTRIHNPPETSAIQMSQ